MKTLFPSIWRMGVLCAALVAIPSGRADTLIWDLSTSAGITFGTGTWDLGTTQDWSSSSAGSNPLLPWSSNDDTASFIASTNSATITISDSQGQVGTYGIEVSGNVSSSAGKNLTFTGDALQIGAGGVVDNMDIATNKLVFAGPVQLTASQTWSSTLANVTASGNISSVGGTTNLTFDGRGGARQFLLQGTNSFAGTTTVTGGGLVELDYTTQNTNKVDASSALIMAGGTLAVNGFATAGNVFTQTVASTMLSSGANTFSRMGNSTQGANIVLQLGTISRNLGATFNIAPGNGTDTIQANNLNVGNILGGWATFTPSGSTAWTWAVTGSSGSNLAIASLQNNGNSRTSSSLWTSTDNVNVTATSTETGIGDQTINSLRFQTANVGLGFNPGATLTITSGGIIAAGAGQSITGGNLTTGMSTGELFVHAPNDFSIGSNIVNGSTSTTLVKDGSGILTLSGNNTYTGATYINAGTVKATSANSISSSSKVIVQGGATFDVTSLGTSGYTVSTGRSLSGGGTVTGNIIVASGGMLTPSLTYFDGVNNTGNSHVETGAMTMTGGLTLQGGSELSFDLGTNSDLLSLTGGAGTALASSSGILLHLADAGGVVVGDTYTLIQWASGTDVSGFSAGDFTWDGLDGNLAISGNALTFTVNAVPEPSTLGFGFFGLLSLIFLVRRRLPGKAAA